MSSAPWAVCCACPMDDRPLEALRIAGGRPLSGEVSVLGAKNAALKHMVASLLAPGSHRLHNVPRILDVEIMARVLDHVGATCERDGTTLLIEVPDAPLPEAPLGLVRQMRASILILGALLARTGEARVALPGGDDFGSRPIDLHLEGLEQMGATFRLNHGVLTALAPGWPVGNGCLSGVPVRRSHREHPAGGGPCRRYDHDRQCRPRARTRRPR